MRGHLAATVLSLLIVICSAPTRAIAAQLKPETIQAWNSYVEELDARNEKQMSLGGPFLSSDNISGQFARLSRGEIVVNPASSHVPLKVPSGLIHDWIGAAFMPDVTLDEILTVIRSYGRYKEFYKPTVTDSKLIRNEGSTDQFSLVVAAKSMIAKTALDADFRSSYTRLDNQHWYCITRSTRIQEIAEYGTPSQHSLPENEGKGVIWRLHSIARFEERNGGVYVELEAIALSREIPSTLHWLIAPMVRRASISSVTTWLRQTQAAARSARESR